MGKPLTVIGFVKMKDGRVIKVDQLTSDERKLWRKNMSDRLSRDMSEYYTQNLEEFKKLREDQQC